MYSVLRFTSGLFRVSIGTCPLLLTLHEIARNCSSYHAQPCFCSGCHYFLRNIWIYSSLRFIKGSVGHQLALALSC
ncbi:hypothetical protein SADUNF_Sadunf10G0132600 [Salix dunnii]|uniref:Uncharacterized protein n=1 Tax=Salix dunnii TaxID=1413687 RepID=A0A835JU11_9ROSI|nr:hypothetical protein SADUNF_Sadunf10G0132600 [Salix dunnii]